MQYYLLLQHLTENQVLKQLEALPALVLRKTIKYTIPQE
jgi:hypothetical protein